MSMSSSSVCTDVESVSSSGLVSDISTVFTNMNQSALRPAVNRYGVGGRAEEAIRQHQRQHVGSVSDSSATSSALILTAEHSPESPAEYLRMCSARPTTPQYSHPLVTTSCNNLTTQCFAPLSELPSPELLVVYDESNMPEKTRCPKVFAFDEQAHQLKVTNNGRYYKNVRKEWASLVATPPSAKFHDALAFTRSLGDFHLHTYGVSQYPEVQCIDLGALIRKYRFDNAIPLVCLVLATDGVWDNWTYEDVTKFVMDRSCVHAVMASGSANAGAARVSHSFLHRNMIHSKHNFGGQADNATCIVMYLSTDQAFPMH